MTRILIVDDHKGVRSGVRSLLTQRADWSVCGEGADGLEGVEMARQLRPDVILMDLSMPRMSGAEATRIIRRDVPGAKVIVISQNDPEAARRQSTDIGAHGFVAKDTLAQQLIPTILTTIGGHDLDASTENLADLEHKRQAAIILDGMYQFVGLLDKKGNILEINRSALEGAGQRIEDIRGKPFWTAQWWQVSEKLQGEIRDAIGRAAAGEFFRHEWEVYGEQAGLATITVDFSLRPIRGESGEIEYLLPEARNITERKQAEEEVARQSRELRILNDRLKELDQLKTQFFANVSHEFRTPLTLMLGPLEDALANTHGVLPLGTATDLATSHRNALRLLKLVNTMLDFSRIEAGRAQGSYQPVDLAVFTAELVSNFQSVCDKAGLRLVVDCAPLDGGEPAYVDRDMWEKIVLNLMSNAFKFTLAGEICVRLSKVDGQACMTISDTGVGIPPEELPHLFKRFHRIEQTRGRTHEGTGIGLALVSELVKLHGGTVGVESVLGKGSAFKVTIPLGNAHLDPERIGDPAELASTTVAPAAYVEEALRWLPDLVPDDQIPLATPSRVEPSPGAKSWKGKPRILWADDNADMRTYVSRLLGTRYDVCAVADGEAALESARARRPDLILSDIMMPKLDGFGLLRALRNDRDLQEVPVILLSARAGEEARLAEGADDYLVKPFSARELLARVQTHLELARFRHDANKTMRENEERLRAFVTASSDVVYRMSADWTKMYHLEGKDFIADTDDPNDGWLDKYIHPEDQPRVMSAIKEAIRAKTSFHLEHRVLRADGSLGWTVSRAIPLLDENGAIVEWFGTASDITARKTTEEKLRESQTNLELRVKQRTEELEKVQIDLRHLSSTLLQLQDEERRRIAADLHDTAGQTLTVLGMNLAGMAELVKANPQLRKKAAEAQELVQRLSQEVRTTSYLLHPPLLDESGITVALKWYIEGLTQRTGLKINLKAPEDFRRLPREIELAMFRIVQECLTNILRHSESKTAEIRIGQDDTSVSLEVEDHGKGMTDERLTAINKGGAGVGIRGMLNRVKQINGEMKVKSGKSGTVISIRLPLSDHLSTGHASSGENVQPTAAPLYRY